MAEMLNSARESAEMLCGETQVPFAFMTLMERPGRS